MFDGRDRAPDGGQIEDAPSHERARARPGLGRSTASASTGAAGWCPAWPPPSRRSSASTPGRALRWASLIGYLLVAPVLFLLLRRRFPPGLSAGLAVACTLAPPVYKWSLGMRVDSWGLMLEALGLLAAVLVKDLGRRWLVLWVAAIGALSITRDATLILLPAVAWLLFVERGDREAHPHQPGAARQPGSRPRCLRSWSAARRCATTSPT